MKPPTHLSWDNFKSSVFLKGQQRVHRVSTSPFIEIFGDGVSNRIGICVQTPVGTQIPPAISKLVFITTRVCSRKGRTLLEVATSSSTLLRQFYHFATAVSERALVEKKTAIEAVGLELQCFSDLLEEKALLGTERQLGLLGELLFLERLIVKWGPTALDAWIGHQGEPHDFRLQNTEYEIKTTVSPQRVHTINGPEQLVPSKGCSLFLVSVQLSPAGGSSGFSLAGKFQTLVKTLAGVPDRLQQFTAAAQACGLVQTELAHYARRFVLRRPLAVVPVDKHFPAITRPVIQSALGSLAARVETLTYDVNLEGLEHEDGTPGFKAALPL